MEQKVHLDVEIITSSEVARKDFARRKEAKVAALCRQEDKCARSVRELRR